MVDPDKARAVLERCRAAGFKVATAESCTGGMIAAALTDHGGASDVVERGFVVYSNAAKAEMLGVAPRLIEDHGAVSAQVAIAMAEGALAHSAADIAVAVTGVAGPSGGTARKPVGLVFIAVVRRGRAPDVHRWRFEGDRAAVRRASAEAALDLVLEAAESGGT
jgi:nicotinamide-nucleotide amidase